MVLQYSEDHTTPTVHKLNYITLVTAIPKKTNHLNCMPNWHPSWMNLSLNRATLQVLQILVMVNLCPESRLPLTLLRFFLRQQKISMDIRREFDVLTELSRRKVCYSTEVELRVLQLLFPTSTRILVLLSPANWYRMTCNKI